MTRGFFLALAGAVAAGVSLAACGGTARDLAPRRSDPAPAGVGGGPAVGGAPPSPGPSPWALPAEEDAPWGDTGAKKTTKRAPLPKSAAAPKEQATAPREDAPAAKQDAPPAGGKTALPEPEKTQRRGGLAEATAPGAAGAPPAGGKAGSPSGNAGPPSAAGSREAPAVKRGAFEPASRSGAGATDAGAGRSGGDGGKMNLPAMSEGARGQVDKLLENRLDVTAYRVQISDAREFKNVIFDRTYDAMKNIDLFREFEDAGVTVDRDAYWVRIALIDVLDREEKFTQPRLYGLDKRRKSDDQN